MDLTPQQKGDDAWFEIIEPTVQRIPFVFNSPHSGRHYPQHFIEASRLDPHQLRRSEDHYVDELFAAATAFGAPMLKATFPRAFVDVNREPYELDPRMFEGNLPPFANISSPRVAGGLGTIPRIVAENMEIYRHRLTVEEALLRIELIYKPYHAALRRLIARTHARFGFCILVDCHSMPGNIRIPGTSERPDVIIGDRYGSSASQTLSQAALDILDDLGFRAVRNKPYAGGFITEHYGRPARGLHALQVEVSRALYVDEASLEKTRGFSPLAQSLSSFLHRLISYACQSDGAVRLAAE